MQSIVIFASGAGSNAAAIINHFRHSTTVRVSLIVCNKPGAGVIEVAEREHIPFLLVTRDTFEGVLLIEQLSDFNPSLLVLAGFLWKVPETLLKAYAGRIINIHPSLLPKYGGKGMYGERVHQAVIIAGDTSSGITVHHVNEHYDEGAVILQAHCPVLPGDNPSSLAQRIHGLEHFYYPLVIEHVLRNM